MYIMPSCFSNNVKSIPSPVKAKQTTNLFEKFIIDNPLIFRVCCFCITRRRKRVDTAKCNGDANKDILERNSDDTVLTIDQIEFTRSTIDLNENAKPNGNELTIQPITLAIGLVESDDATSEQNVIKTQPSAKSKKSDDIINNKDLVDNYVEEQVRRTSGKTNSHILSDVENSPLHLSKGSTSSVIENVRNEIAQIQSAIQGVKKEMEEMQKTKSIANTPSHKNSTRSASANSNKTFIYEPGEAEVDGGYERHIIKPGQTLEINASPQKARPATAKSVLKPESPFQRIVTPTPDDVITDDQLSSSPYDPIIEMPMEIHEEETEEISENIPTEIEEDERSIIDPMVMIRSDSTMTISRENINEEYEVEEEETAAEQDSEYAEVTPSPLPREVFIKSHRTPIKANRPAVLKRSHKSTPVKNPMPNLNQMPSVVIRAPKSNALFPPSLRRFDRPKDAMNTTMHQLESSNWEDVMEGLKNFVRLIRHHPEYVDSQIHLFTLAIGKQVKNLRSQVSRAGCSAAGEFFITHAKVLDADAEELAASLLNRTADTNKFLRADATRALESMCDALHPSKCILILSYRGASHQNAAVRCTTAKLLNELVFRIGCDKVFNMHKEIRDRLILTGANLLMEGSLETRNHTKELFKQLSIHSQYQKLLLDIIPSNVYRNIEKALKSIR